ncbi:MAG: prepilin-type N-terminal cleavage/methylation domain-containing protein [Planctomycetota bacterium]
MRTRGRLYGFTLIEVLIVVALVAVLAAVVIPKFATSTRDAKEASLDYNLKVMRSQITVYEAHHFGDYPAIRNNDLPQLTGATNTQGEIGASGPNYPLGPYVDQALPVNPFDESNEVTPVAVPGQKPTGVVGNLGGWQYDESNGAVWPNHPGYYGQQIEQAEVIVPPGP